jgi:hypothetical protein
MFSNAGRVWIRPLAALNLSLTLFRYMLRPMKATIVGLISPHVLRVMDLAKQAEAGANVDWHLRDTVAKTIGDLGHQYNARELLSAYIQGLQAAADDAGRVRKAYADALQAAAAIAERDLKNRD